MVSDQYITLMASSLSRMSEARAVRVASNSRAGVATCAGCMADGIGSQEARERNCARMCAQGICQKQIYIRLNMADILVRAMEAMVHGNAFGPVVLNSLQSAWQALLEQAQIEETRDER